MGLIKASAGHVEIFGHAMPCREALAKVGFLPETPYFYEYLTVEELLDLAGRLCGVSKDVRMRRANELIEQVGLGYARKMWLRKFSKGMLQRAGIAQALMHDPELIVFDEPMGGLDPIGRKEVKDIILSLRDQGKTVFFSSHILADVESMCDRVAIIAKGELKVCGPLKSLLQETRLGTHVSLNIDKLEDTHVAELRALANTATSGDGTFSLAPDVDVDAFIQKAMAGNARVQSITPRFETLEDLFVRLTNEVKEAAR